MLGDEDAVLVLRRELVAGIELHAEAGDVRALLVHRRRELRALALGAVLGIGQVALVAVRIAEMLTDLAHAVELVVRQIVVDPVAPVVGEPELAAPRVDCAADAVAHAQRHQLGLAGLRVHAAILAGAGRRQADVTRHADRDVEPALAVGHQVLPAVRHVGREVVVHDLAFRRLLEVGLGIVVAVELVDIDDVERAVLEGDAGRHAQPGDEGLCDLLAIGAADGMDRALVEGADEQRALVAPRHLARLGDARRPHRDLEAGRQLDLGEDLVEFGLGRRRRLARIGRLALLLLVLVAEEPVRRRLQPEILAAGIVLLEIASLCLHRPGTAAEEGCDHADKADFRPGRFLSSHGCLLWRSCRRRTRTETLPIERPLPRARLGRWFKPFKTARAHRRARN